MPFNPSTISGCKLWLKADAGLFNATSGGSAVTTDAALVARWEDQSGSGNHRTQATSADQPALKLAILNSLPSVRFAGLGTTNGDYLGGTLGANITGTVLSAFVVTVRRAIVANASSVTGTDGSTHDYDSAAEVIPFFENNGELIKTYRNADLSTLATHPGNNVAYQCGTVFNGTNNTLYQNGTGQTPVASTGSFNFSILAIGCRREGGAYTHRMNGDLAEVLVYQAALGTSDRQSVEGYLAWRWGLQGSLPGGHPYKSSAPGGGSLLRRRRSA